MAESKEIQELKEQLKKALKRIDELERGVVHHHHHYYYNTPAPNNPLKLPDTHPMPGTPNPVWFKNNTGNPPPNMLGTTAEGKVTTDIPTANKDSSRNVGGVSNYYDGV